MTNPAPGAAPSKSAPAKPEPKPAPAAKLQPGATKPALESKAAPAKPEPKPAAAAKAQPAVTRPAPEPKAGQTKSAGASPAKAPKPLDAQFPFPFRHHGALNLSSFGKAAGAYIAFERAPTRQQIEEIAKSCPAPIRGLVAWTDTLLSTESHGDGFDWQMLEHYGTEADKMASQQSNWAEFGKDSADRFSNDVERWALATHAVAPIRFVIGPCRSAGGDPWDDWTGECLADVIVSFVEDYIRRNADMPEKNKNKNELGEISRAAIASLLQELEPGRGLTMSDEIAARAAKLREAFAI
jgi:hypothetical protein